MEASATAITREKLSGNGPGYRRRRLVNRMMEFLSTFAAVLAVAVLLLVIVSVFIKGVSALNLDFFTKEPAPFGETGGGIANSIVGSAILIALATLISVPIGILIGIYTVEFAPRRIAAPIQFCLDILNGVPTIITGIFIFGLLVVNHAQSGWAGAIALGIVELPIVARSAQEVLALVPRSLHEAALALGLRRWRLVTRIVLPTAAGGLITGAVLGVARVAGETAPLLFTTSIFSNTGITTSPSQPLPNIPVTIFTLSESPSPSDHAQAWAAALVLVAFVLILSVSARTFHERSRRRLSG
ncbi:MAG TPA: phosphate ABC transporter permease PstA [Solirubrobacteraceae bacterium]|nr:phosphate ABC transporter permease PstA [Solirubrobacteraceae bacterium]